MSRTTKKGKSKDFPKEKDQCLRETNRILRQKVKQLQETIEKLNKQIYQLKQIVESDIDKSKKLDYTEPVKINTKKKEEETVDDVRERFRKMYSGYRPKDKGKDN